VQNGRLHYNWIGSRGVEYARYNTVRAEFLDKVDQFKGFLAKTGVGELRVNQWEVTYVNNLPAGSVWATPDQWNDVFSAQIALPARLPNSRLESLAGVWTYEIEPQRGRLHVEIQHGRTSSTSMSQDLLVFRLTARGPVSSGAKEFVTGLDLGHETIVRSFKALTSDTARKEWGEL